MTTFKSNGKLLLTSEYVVLDGAKALALPTIYGQNLNITPKNTSHIDWKSYNEMGTLWYKDKLPLPNPNNTPIDSIQNEISHRLIALLKAAKELNPKFLNTPKGYTITTHQDFNRHWGLGTSSTLVNNIALWAGVDPYQLLDKTFGGSGYDIACAQNNSPILYQRLHKNKPLVYPVTFNPPFKQHLYFVYLNQKQNSRAGIKSYRALPKVTYKTISWFNQFSTDLLNCTVLSDFEAMIASHENYISELIKQPTAKSRLFSDFNGGIKSLGAWGGDFILVTSKTNPSTYFKTKGFETVIPYDKMILN